MFNYESRCDGEGKTGNKGGRLFPFKRVARALGGAEDFNACEGNVETRYALFEKSYKDQKITRSEFSDLVGDLLRLETVDTSGCTLATRVKLQQALSAIQTAASLLGAL